MPLILVAFPVWIGGTLRVTARGKVVCLVLSVGEESGQLFLADLIFGKTGSLPSLSLLSTKAGVLGDGSQERVVLKLRVSSVRDVVEDARREYTHHSFHVVLIVIGV